MEYLIFIIPFLVAIFLFFKFRKETVWWEYALLIVPSILMSLLIEFCMVSYEESSKEYLGAHATKITYVEDWDEWIIKTCHRRVKIGKNSYSSIPYDCSYRQYHPKEYYMSDNIGKKLIIEENEYNRIKNLWKTPVNFQDMKRKYLKKDGDVYFHRWDSEKNTIRTITHSNSYKNKVKVSKSIFNLEHITKEQATEMGLFEYPEIVNHDQQTILGYKNVTHDDVVNVNYINGIFGRECEFRMFILVFYDKDIDISMKQRSYWVGGNKNEFVICIGLDSSTNKIQWTNAFSWADEPKLEVNTEQYFNGKDSLNISEFCDSFIRKIPSQWKRKSFEDFEYLKVELSHTQYVWIMILTLLYNIGISIFIVVNDYKNEEKSDYNKWC